MSDVCAGCHQKVPVHKEERDGKHSVTVYAPCGNSYTHQAKIDQENPNNLLTSACSSLARHFNYTDQPIRGNRTSCRNQECERIKTSQQFAEYRVRHSDSMWLGLTLFRTESYYGDSQRRTARAHLCRPAYTRDSAGAQLQCMCDTH